MVPFFHREKLPRPTTEQLPSQPIVEVRSLIKRYANTTVLNGVSHVFERGQVSVICGPSGCGKSTLLRCIHALEEFQEGDILIEGKSLRQGGLNLPKLRERIGMVFQQPNLYPHLTCLQNITLAPRKVRGHRLAEAEQEAMTLMDRVGVGALAKRYPAEISGGQQQRVAIARALAMRPALMLFDEPTSSLDPERVSEVLDVISVLAADKITMIIVTHEMRFAAHVASEIVFMDAGRVVEVGGPDFCENPKTDRARNFVRAILH
jgi:ABC-type polar amino acid transport system ATPase subunit